MPEGKKIKLGKNEYLIPELAIRQRRVVFPLVIKTAPVIQELALKSKLHELTEEELNDMTEVVYQGVSRGLPHLTRDNFLDLVFDIHELVYAFDVVASQAGFEPPEEEAERPKLPGETNGETKTAESDSPPTGSNTSTT